MRWSFHESTTSSSLLLSFFHISKNSTWHCKRQRTRQLTCSSIPALEKAALLACYTHGRLRSDRWIRQLRWIQLENEARFAAPYQANLPRIPSHIIWLSIRAETLQTNRMTHSAKVCSHKWVLQALGNEGPCHSKHNSTCYLNET
jgi:hypothetical protein